MPRVGHGRPPPAPRRGSRIVASVPITAAGPAGSATHGHTRPTIRLVRQDRLHHRGGGGSLPRKPADHHPLLRFRSPCRIPRPWITLSPHPTRRTDPFHAGEQHPDRASRTRAGGAGAGYHRREARSGRRTSRGRGRDIDRRVGQGCVCFQRFRCRHRSRLRPARVGRSGLRCSRHRPHRRRSNDRLDANTPADSLFDRSIAPAIACGPPGRRGVRRRSITRGSERTGPGRGAGLGRQGPRQRPIARRRSITGRELDR